LCEQAADDLANGRVEAARQRLQEAISKAPDAARPRLAMAQLHAGAGDFSKAHQVLMQALDNAPSATSLVVGPLADMALKTGDLIPTLKRLEALYQQSPSLDLLDGIVLLSAHQPGAHESERDWYARHLEREPSLVAATRWIAQEKLEHEQFHPQVQRALDHAIKPLLRYRCAACGFEATQHFWQCPGCQTWDSYPARRVEEI
jgi:lipopolysaccharide biosynthesis regulator YciM